LPENAVPAHNLRRPLLVAAALVVLLAGWLSAAETQSAAESTGRLKLATCQFPVSADISENARGVRRLLCLAKEEGVDLVHFPETALSGYAPDDHETLDHLDWRLLRRETQSILDLAARHKLWVVLGSTHRLTGHHKPHNSLYVISPEGRIVDRYDKRFCTIEDLKHYSPGNHPATFEVRGVKCGLLICHDYRYPELYREYARAGVRLVLHSFYNSEKGDEAARRKQAVEYAQVYASMNGMFVSYTNTSRRWAWPACFVVPDGQLAATLPRDEAGIMVNEVDIHRKYDDASGPFRRGAIEGQLHSGRCVDDPRSTDRGCY
jgi:deaminated glutathione amidase